MKKLLLLLLLVIIKTSAQRIAIFDYDNRSIPDSSISDYIETEIRKSIKTDTIIHFSGKGNDDTALVVLEKIESENFDLVITITSDAMIPAYHRIKSTPWLFTNVNNPRFFGISLDRNSAANVSGVTYYVPVNEQMNLFSEILGDSLKSIGVIFDNVAKSRKVEVGEFRKEAKQRNLSYSLEILKDLSQFTQLAEKLIANDVDAIIITSSDKLYTNLNMITDICRESKVPIFSVNPQGVANGAIAAFASDYYQMVNECLIPMVEDVIIHKKSPGEIPIGSLKKPGLYINETAAKEVGIEIAPHIMKKATRIY